MIKKIRIRNYKSYVDSTLELSDLTVMIGANASGKSNALEALNFLSWIASGRKISEMFSADASGVVRGGDIQIIKDGCDAMCLCASVGNKYEFEIEIEKRDDGFHIIKERLATIQEGDLYKMSASSSGESNIASVVYRSFTKGKWPSIKVNDQRAIISQLDSAAPFERKHRKSSQLIPSSAIDCASELSKIVFIDPLPARMRGYSFISDREIKGDASNISSLVYDICKNESGKESILDFIKSVPEQDIADISFIETPRHEVMFCLNETFGEIVAQRDASVLSDGTLRVIAVAAVLLSAKPETLVVIEEIDNGIHPGRAKKLIDGISSVARQRRLQVLLTTHNPALLDALPYECISDTVFCYRDSSDGSSKLVRLDKISGYSSLVSQGSLGEILTQGVIDRFVKQNPRRRIRKPSEWLEMHETVGVGHE